MTDMSLQTPPAKIKVLVIEDDTLTRLTLCRLLQKMEYKTFEACNGFMGLSVYSREKPDVVITDLLMPDKEGIETIAEIRAQDQGVKIVAMSGGGSAHNMGFLDLARRMGANCTISKPFRPEDISLLMETLKQAGSQIGGVA